MFDDFLDKVVIITGGAGGLGIALTQQLIEQGAMVVALDLDVSQLNASENLLPLEMDITDRNAIESALQTVIHRFGKIDLLFNNAGITHMSRLADTSQELFDAIMAVNFTGSVDITRLALPYLKQSQGQIIALSSVAGFAPLYGRSAYAASKHAMEGFFLSLSAELKEHGVDVLMVRPSFVKSRPELQAQVNAGISSPGAMKKSTNGEQIDPDTAALKILSATEQRKPVLQLGRVSKIAYWLNALIPRSYMRIMIKGAIKEFQ